MKISFLCSSESSSPFFNALGVSAATFFRTVKQLSLLAVSAVGEGLCAGVASPCFSFVLCEPACAGKKEEKNPQRVAENKGWNTTGNNIVHKKFIYTEQHMFII